ncbi:MAG: DUF542 domain-containing protein, partial [Candidatus Scalindua sp.]
MNEMARKITKEMIVNEVTVKYPHTAEIFTKHGLDMCCGGVQSIEKTAVACNVNLEELLDVLNQSLSEQVSTEEEVKDAGKEESREESIEEPTVAQPEAPELKEVTGKTTVKEIIKNYPQTKGLFSKYGLLECGGEYGPEEAIYFFARVHNVDGDSLIKEINDVIQG